MTKRFLKIELQDQNKSGGTNFYQKNMQGSDCKCLRKKTLTALYEQKTTRQGPKSL